MEKVSNTLQDLKLRHLPLDKRADQERQIAAMGAMQDEARRQHALSRELRVEISKNRFWLGESAYAQLDEILKDFTHATISIANDNTLLETRERRDRLYRVLKNVRAEIWLERVPNETKD